MTVCAYILSKRGENPAQRSRLCELKYPEHVSKRVIAELAENKPEDFCLDCNAVIIEQYEPVQLELDL